MVSYLGFPGFSGVANLGLDNSGLNTWHFSTYVQPRRHREAVYEKRLRRVGENGARQQVANGSALNFQDLWV